MLITILDLEILKEMKINTVNRTMYFDNLEDVKQYANEIICFYSDNDSYVKYEVEKDFADKIVTEQV